MTPAGTIDGLHRFQWLAGDARPPFTVVVLDAAYSEVLRRDGIEATEWAADDAVRAALGGGRMFHWYVLGDGLGRPLASPLATAEID